MTRDELRAGQRDSAHRTRLVYRPLEIGGRLRTHDGEKYVRDHNGTIRAVAPKVKGKAARRAEKRARRASQ